MEQQKELTEEQKKALKKLNHTLLLSSILVGVKYGLVLLVANLIVAGINKAFVNSDGFVFIMAVVNTFMVFSHMRQEQDENIQRTKDEAKKILES